MQKVIGLYESPDDHICAQLNRYLREHPGYRIAMMHDVKTEDGWSVLVVLEIPDEPDAKR